MEKYFLAKADHFPSKSRQESQAKLVEIQYSRKPPSFGLVYFAEQADLSNANSTRDIASSHPEVRLAAFDLSESKSVGLKTIRQVQLRATQVEQQVSRIVDFHSADSVQIDEDQQSTSRRDKQLRSPDCVGLDENGRIYGVWLSDATFELIGQPQELRLTQRQFIQIRLQRRRDDEPNDDTTDVDDFCWLHVLAQKTYWLYKLSSSRSFELLAEYSMRQDEHSSLHFLRLFQVESSPHLVVLETSDWNLQFLFKCKSLSVLKTRSRGQRQLVIAGNTKHEFVLLTADCSTIEAHSFQVTEISNRTGESNEANGEKERDPDRILPREPSHELEKCWSLDLQDIESIRTLLDESDSPRDGGTEIRVSTMWTYNEPFKLSQNIWPKFLVVAYKFHILIYSFEQQQAPPFSVVYDQSFLKLIQDRSETKGSSLEDGSGSEFIDPRSKPQLLHNFKVIGPQPGDSLFNTLFLANGCSMRELAHFSHLGLLVGLADSGHLMAFKFNSPKIVTHSDNVLQQKVRESILSEALLRTQIAQMEQQISQIQDEVTKMNGRQPTSSSVSNTDIQLERLILTKLTQRQDLGCLYDLSISLPGFVQVGRLLVILTVDSYILEPSSPELLQFEINNDPIDDDTQVPLYFPAVRSADRVSVEQLARESQTSRLDFIASWCLIDFERSMPTSIDRNIQLCLPIFITDGQSGSLNIYFELATDNSDSAYRASRAASLIAAQELADQVEASYQIGANYLTRRIDIKPLMSYEASNPFAATELPSTVEIGGVFEQEAISRWLDGCFRLPNSSLVSGRLVSTFSRSCIEFRAERGKLIVSSDNVLAIETLKQYVLKRATDESVRLETDQSEPTLSLSLSHLISLQYGNIIRLAELTRSYAEADPELDTAYLLESLLAEIRQQSNELELSFDDIEPQIELDLDSLVRDRIPTTETNSAARMRSLNMPSAFRDLICGFIVDTLVDFDKLQGKKVSTQSIVAMRSSLIEFILPKGMHMSATSFASKTLDEWKKNTCSTVSPTSEN